MKIAPIDNPVHASWLKEQGLRLDADPYVSDAYQARKVIESLPGSEPLSEVTERIFRPGIFRRQWANDPEHGVPFLGSAAIFQADLSNLPMITRRSFEKTAGLALKPGWTLITCSGMTSGRVTYSRLDMDGYACGQDVIRAVPAQDKVSPGYLYTFLASKYGRAMIKGKVYGTSVKHIEPEHIADLPVPRLSSDIELEIDNLIQESMTLRSNSQDALKFATVDLFESANLSELITTQWTEQPRSIGFAAHKVSSKSLRALNYEDRSHKIFEALQSVDHITLGEICQSGKLNTGPRFKRIDTDPENGVCLVGQRQAFWLRPEGRWISPSKTPKDVFVDDETVLIAEHGLIGETAIICRAMFVSGRWTKYAYTQDFLRIQSGNPDYPGAYLFPFLRSNPAFRVLRSMLVGTGPQEINLGMCAQLPVPTCTPEDRQRIAETVRQAYRWRDEADMKEDEALALLEQAVREAAR